MEVIQNIKCVIVGGRAVGKTSLLNSFVAGPLSDASPFESYNGIKVQIEENNEIFQLELWDTNSANHNKIIRKMYYEHCNLLIVCYSVMDHEAYKEVRRKVSEVKVRKH
jgi:Ras homolog gene family, member H